MTPNSELSSKLSIQSQPLINSGKNVRLATLCVVREKKGEKGPFEELKEMDEETEDFESSQSQEKREKTGFDDLNSEGESEGLLDKSEVDEPQKLNKDVKTIFPMFEKTYERKNEKEVRVCLK